MRHVLTIVAVLFLQAPAQTPETTRPRWEYAELTVVIDAGTADATLNATWYAAEAAPPGATERWTSKDSLLAVQRAPQRLLDAAGVAGWELVSIVHTPLPTRRLISTITMYYFKRQR